jgi:Metallo-beta-lactamase superfamily
VHALVLLLALTAQTNVDRAIAALGGAPALERARLISVVMVGTQDSSAIAQGYFSERPTPQRYQETLILDAAARRASFRWEGSWSDGSPTAWRQTVLGDEGFSIKLKTGNVSRWSKANAEASFEHMTWRVPHLALAEMQSRATDLQCESATRCSFKTRSGLPFHVLFDDATGLLSAYEFTVNSLTGPQAVRFAFKPYVRTGIGLYPSGSRITIGGATYRDVDLLGARRAELAEHPWLVPPPADARPVSTVSQRPPASVEEVAPNVWFIRNVGGYNALFARVGDCVAVFDAPASFPMGNVLPFASPTIDHAQVIAEKVRETTGRAVCYVVPTHHHSDHFGSVAGFAKLGATIVTSPNNVALARRVAAAAGVRDPKIEVVRDAKLTLGSGDDRIDIHLLRNDPHAEEMLFAHFPSKAIVFEGDLVDYVVSSWNLLRFIDEKGLRVERVFSSHSATPRKLADLQWEEPGN